MHVRGRMQTGDTPYGGYAGTGKSCIHVHHFCLSAPRNSTAKQESARLGADQSRRAGLVPKLL
jgi:hypothetical protein